MQISIDQIQPYHIEDYPMDLTAREVIDIIKNPGTVSLWADAKTPRSIYDALTLEVLTSRGCKNIEISWV